MIFWNMITVRSVRLFAADCLLYRRVTNKSDSNLLYKDLSNLEKWRSKFSSNKDIQHSFFPHAISD
jgi:hypothetical protein